MLFQQIDDPLDTGWALYQRGLLEVNLNGDPRSGLKYAESALAQFKQTKSQFGNALALTFIGGCWVTLDEADKAELVLKEAYSVFVGTNDFDHAGAEPEGRGRKDDDLRQPGRRPRAAGPGGAAR